MTSQTDLEPIRRLAIPGPPISCAAFYYDFAGSIAGLNGCIRTACHYFDGMSASNAPEKPLVGVAGASGFVGTHLIRHLGPHFRFRALSRSPNVVAANVDGEEAIEWRQCDLYSLPKVAEALEGCDLAIYLVHSMAPSSRLMQGVFEDTDLLLADNFIRAAETVCVKHVVYLSGLMPQGEYEGELSPHLRSRWEVEKVIRSRDVTVTVLRAGLIFGPGGSSFSMLINLVRRLPVMILPAWAHSVTQSIDIHDVCRAFELCLCEEDMAGETYDLGGHDPMTYRMLIDATAVGLGRDIRYIDFPFNCFGYTKFWVSLFGGVPMALVGPLQESLKYDLVARPNKLLERLRGKMIPLHQSLEKSVDQEGQPLSNPRSKTIRADKKDIKRARRVRSVQRMLLPKGLDAEQIAAEYASWLTKHFRGVITAWADASGVVRFSLLSSKIVLLELTRTPFTVGNRQRCAFYITGGLLTRNVEPKGRLEFRLVPELSCMIASIHGFAPMLPWWVYSLTQAKLHLRVMKRFADHLQRLKLDQLTGRAETTSE